jgi:hypothetical protein
MHEEKFIIVLGKAKKKSFLLSFANFGFLFSSSSLIVSCKIRKTFPSQREREKFFPIKISPRWKLLAGGKNYGVSSSSSSRIHKGGNSI